MSDRCPTCGDPLVGQGPACLACERLSVRFHKIYETGQGHGDSDYAMHELAHCVLLLGRRPRNKADMRDIQLVLDELPIGSAQVHELRTVRLQHEAYRAAGLRSSIRRHLDLTWHGIQEAVEDCGRTGSEVVSTKRQALRLVRSVEPSTRKVRLLVRLYQELRAG